MRKENDMRTNSCANCKHRHDMICIPESKDCAPYYFLDIEDLNGRKKLPKDIKIVSLVKY